MKMNATSNPANLKNSRNRKRNGIRLLVRVKVKVSCSGDLRTPAYQ